jgi:hypothetical protein
LSFLQSFSCYPSTVQALACKLRRPVRLKRQVGEQEQHPQHEGVAVEAAHHSEMVHLISVKERIASM